MKRLLPLLLVAAACNQTPINTPVRSFDRPTDVALTCAIHTAVYDQNNLDIGYDTSLPLSDCAPLTLAQLQGATNPPLVHVDPNDKTYSYYPRLLGLVSNSARGEVALVDIPNAKLRDLDFQNPGYNFIPVGRLPQAIRATVDGCAAITANADSCDLSLLDVNVMYNMDFEVLQPGQQDFALNVVRNVELWAGDHRLESRPTAIEVTQLTGASSAPTVDNPDFYQVCQDKLYRAWVALPGCEAIVETTFSLYDTPDNGGARAPFGNTIRRQITQAIHIGPDGATILADPTQLVCPAECTGATAPAVVSDGGVPGGVLPATQSAPVTIGLQIDSQTQRLAIGDYYSERVSLLTLDPTTGTAHDPTSVVLESGALGVLKTRISPRTPAGQFVYALARDGTARVIDLDREVECETNPDPLMYDVLSDIDPEPRAREFGCLPLGDPATPARSANAIGPGIQLPNNALVRDVAFVHLDAPLPNFDNGTEIVPPSAGPSLLVGDFAWLFGSDGRGNVVDIFDACPQPDIPYQISTNVYSHVCDIPMNAAASVNEAYELNFGNPYPTNLERLSHRLRLGSIRFLQPNDAQDQAGTPRLQDTTEPLTITVQGSPGVEGNGFRLPTLESVPVALPGLASPGTVTYLDFPDPIFARNENWTLDWEGVIGGTIRTTGRMCGAGDASCPRNAFIDAGADVCGRGVLAGDRLDLIGCQHDKDCLYTQKCLKDPASPSTVTTGLCLSRNTAEDDQIENRERARCGLLMRAARRYRIDQVRQSFTLDNGDVTDVLDLSEIYEPEYAIQTHTCSTDDDCLDVTVTPDVTSLTSSLLPTQCLRDTDGQNKCLRGCSLDGTGVVGGCGAGYECAQSAQSTDGHPDTRCMRAPLDLGLFQDCLSYPESYQIRVGGAFSVTGGSSGFLSDLVPDPTTGICEQAPGTLERIRLRNPRLPLDPPLCPQQPLVTSGIDALSYQGMGAPNACLIQTNDTDLLLHFEGPILSFALRIPDNPTGFVPADDTTLVFGVVGGGFPLSLSLSIPASPAAQNPIANAVAPDMQTVFVVDEGKGTSATSLRGQLLRLVSGAQACDPTFSVR